MSLMKDTIKTGFLTKSPPENKGPFYGWKRRFFMFIDSSRVYPFAPRHIRMEYYHTLEESKSGNPLNSINLNDCSGVLKREPMKGHKNVFDIVTPTRVFHLSADSNAEREEWVNLLNINVFTFTKLRPGSGVELLTDLSMTRSNRLSEFPPEIDLSKTKKGTSRGVGRSQSLRDKSNVLEPLSPQDKPDVFFPLVPNPGSPNSYSPNLKLLTSQQSTKNPSSICDNNIQLSINEKEIISDPGFTAVPQSMDFFGDMQSHSSLPVTNESPYMNVVRHMQKEPPPQPLVSLSADSSPIHPLLPAPYKKTLPSDGSQGLTSPLKPSSVDDIESEYSCIDPSNISESILVQYAKVQRNK